MYVVKHGVGIPACRGPPVLLSSPHTASFWGSMDLSREKNGVGCSLVEWGGVECSTPVM